MKTAPAPLWPADKVERRPLSSLVPAARNARTHSPEQVAQLAASIREWGWTVPVLVDEGGRLIAGHGRVLAAAELGLTSVPTMVAAGWSEAQVRAYRIADNKLAQNADWDDGLLLLELGELRGLEVDLGLLGFGAEELEALFAPPVAGLTDPDEAPEPPARPVSLQGDVWLLGRHRLVCGDSTDVDDVGKAMRDERAKVCFTSPPYAQQRDYDGSGINDWDATMRGVFSTLRVTHDAQVLVNLGLVHRHGEWLPYWDGWIEWMRSAGWRRFGWYVWDQGWGLPGDWNGRLAPSHEFVFHFNKVSESPRKIRSKKLENIKSRVLGSSSMRRKDGKTIKFTNPGASASTNKIADSVIRINRQVGRVGVDLDHPAVFPVALPRDILETFSNSSDCVYEPFCGSGTTIIAAEMTGRACYAIELSPAYVDVAVRRWQDFTGEQATLDGDGRTFAAVADERLPYDADADSLGSYHDAVAAVGKRVKAGAPVPAFFLKQQQGA